MLSLSVVRGARYLRSSFLSSRKAERREALDSWLNFFRGFHHEPNYMVSKDDGQTWTYGGHWLCGKGSYSPYLKYAYDGKAIGAGGLEPAASASTLTLWEEDN